MGLPKLNKKGQGIGDLPQFVQLFVIAGVILGVGALILVEMKESFAPDPSSINTFGINSTINGTIALTAGQNMSNSILSNATGGLVEMAGFLPIVGISIAAVMLLGIVLMVRARSK